MMEYTVTAYNEGKIDAELNIINPSEIKMEMIDLDAIRWFRGEITTKQLFEQYKKFFLRQS